MPKSFDHRVVLGYSRRTFLARLGVGLAASWWLSPDLWAAKPDVHNQFAWARLISPSPFWNIHQDQDEQLANFMREQTGIAIDPQNRSVAPENLEALCSYPIIFTNSLLPITSPAALANIKDYIDRGGFLYVDSCINWKVTPDVADFSHQHVSLFVSLFPKCEVRSFSEKSPIFHAYFKLNEADTRNGRGQRGHWAGVVEALYGVYDGERLLAILSLDHLQCGWPNDEERMIACLKLMTNICVYAMMR